MKRLTRNVVWFARLTSSALVSASVLLISQHALAAGTTAGTTISNQAQVDYDVGGVAQTYILSDPNGNSVPGASGALTTDFVVDNRVDFTLVEAGLLTHTEVTPGQVNAFVQFNLENNGNSIQDFRLVAINLTSAGATPHGLTDTDVDMSNMRVFVDNDGNGLDLLVDQDYVDELAEDDNVDIYVVADADISLVNGGVANIDLLAVVADAGGGGSPGADTTDDAGSADTSGVDVVFAEGGALGDGQLNAQDGFTVSSAALTVSKSSSLLSDPFNGGSNPKAIPGAVIEYVITVENTGAQLASNVVLTDTLNTVLLQSDAYSGANEFRIDNDGAVSECTEEADGDLCSFAGGTVTIGVAVPAVGLDVAAGTTLTVTFQVSIPIT